MHCVKFVICNVNKMLKNDLSCLCCFCLNFDYKNCVNMAWTKATTTTWGYFAIHVSSQTTKKEVSENPHLRTINPRKLLSLCDTTTFVLVQSQVLHNSRT